MNRTLTYTFAKRNEQPENQVTRISDFLKKQGYPSSVLTTLRHTEGACRLNGIPVRMNTILSGQDLLTVHIPETITSEKIVPVELPFPVVYEDEDLVVVDKPAGMPIHPSIRHYENTLANAAAYYYRDKPFVYRCINRLDKDTSGLTILAKNPLSGSMLQQMMRERRIQRTYYAVVEGRLDGNALESTGTAGVRTDDAANKSYTIHLPIGRKQASIIERMVDFKNGEDAITHFQVLHATDACSFVECKLETGRTHQIRVHMSAIGHPLVGDYIYNPRYGEADIKRQALHAGALSFVHPITKEQLDLTAKLPSDMLMISSLF